MPARIRFNDKHYLIEDDVLDIIGTLVEPPATPPLGIVPEPVPYTPPTPLRTVHVATDEELVAAIRTATPGTAIQLAPGSYAALKIVYANPADWHGATAENPLQIIGAPNHASKLASASLVNANFVVVRDVRVGPAGLSFNGSATGTVSNCNIVTTGSTHGIYITNQNRGQFQFLNNRICRDFPTISGAFSVGHSNCAGIAFQYGRQIGDDNRIAGNVISGYHDGLQCGGWGVPTTAPVPSHNLVIERNFIYDIEDDAIEADGWHEQARIVDNVVGGTQRSCTAGISLAPGGPGPNAVVGNSISGFYNLPFKFNTDVADAFTENVTIGDNVIVQTSEPQDPAKGLTCWYFAGPVKKLANLTIIDNYVLARGCIFATEAFTIPSLVIDRNRLWSTGEFPLYGQPTLFRFFDPGVGAAGSNVYMNSIEELRAKFGFERAGSYGPMRATPVPIPGFAIESLCRWRIGYWC